MNYRISLVLLLSLAACGESKPFSNANSSDSETVLALSRAAVEEAEPAPIEASFQVEPISEEPFSDGIALGEDMMTDAVPISDPVVEPLEEVEPEVMAQFSLRRGETLDHFARWSGFPVEDIAGFSDLDLDGDYPVGTEILLPAEGEALAEIEVNRDEHWQRRVDGYLSSRGGAVSTEFYSIRTGDSAWGIARDKYSMPIWVLEAYNPSVDLDRLRPGQELLVPVLADTVVDATPSDTSLPTESE
ncbi:MAG: LysM peptidoglycan-binding domain-containing protein [Deltaproteobacteria bacterium]|nr:LysM peptidoglycan-binding domain-containing protein [Deltaproteobacteria bacterium]